MDAPTHNGLLQLLGSAMSDVSEESYCAGWLGGWEYYLPEFCRRALESRQTQIWGRCDVTVETASTLKFLADQVGSWAMSDVAGFGYIPHSPFPIPQQFLDDLDKV